MSRPSIECAISGISCLLLRSAKGSVSLSELRKLGNASDDVLSPTFLLVIFLKARWYFVLDEGAVRYVETF